MKDAKREAIEALVPNPNPKEMGKQTKETGGADKAGTEDTHNDSTNMKERNSTDQGKANHDDSGSENSNASNDSTPQQ